MSSSRRAKPIVAVSQSVELRSERGERRDWLDQRLSSWLLAVGTCPVPVPNAVASDAASAGVHTWLCNILPDAILLSGGNDLGAIPERDLTESTLLHYARCHQRPVLGICRGMQMLAADGGTELREIDGHIASRHALDSSSGELWPTEVNSFHRYGLAGCPRGFIAVATARKDGSIEAIRHESLPWEGWMWHPEREVSFATSDVRRARRLFGIEPVEIR